MSATRKSNKRPLQAAFGLAAALAAAAAGAAEAQLVNGDGSAWIGIEQAHAYAEAFLDDDLYSGRFTVQVDSEDVGRPGELYLVARLNGMYYMKTGGRWREWNLDFARLEPYDSKLLSAREELVVVDRQWLPAGDFRVFAAYRSGTGPLVFAHDSLDFQVASASGDALHRFASAEAMEDYLKQGMGKSGAGGAWLPFLARAQADAIAGDAGSRVSGTNLQVAGVDEADSVKTDGELLYSLHSCEFEACLAVYRLNPELASASRLAAFQLKGDVDPEGLYLLEDRDLLLSVGGRNPFGLWFDVWGWAGNRTEVEFFDISDPAALVSTEKLSLDGGLVASRVVGDTLYLVTRYTPSVEGFQPIPLEAREQESNARLLADTSLPELLPRVEDSSGRARELIQSKDCYLPTADLDQSNNPSIITVTSVPLDTPTAFNSTCFLGASETLYMTERSLYLATTRHDYQVIGLDALVYQPDHSTAIHKFALAGGEVEYRGSAEVEGHLGWIEDKKSFRLGENGDYLNVVTSVGDSFGDSSSTMLTVLAESEFSNDLVPVARLEGIGKPGEQLYAARFIGDRAYLVTFRLTDPLYVVDLSDQSNPRISGELEIAGYSDYLHPVSEDLLLGIGKDAVPDTSGDGDARGAWAQGLKLALFDVSNPAAPRELDSRVLGRRGTESPALWDHHALAWLPAGPASQARLAIPVQLHDAAPQWDGWDSAAPDAWYAFTHTGLYSFEVGELGISQVGRIIGTEAEDIGGPVRPLDGDAVGTDDGKSDEGEVSIDPAPGRMILPYGPSYGDRAVLVEDAVYYIHQGEVLGSFWGENR